MSASFIEAFFNLAFDRVTKTLEFNAKWANGTGNFHHVAEGPYAPILGAGEMAKSSDSSGRKMIIVGLPVGNLVVFRRYSKEDGVYAYNASRHFEQVWMGVFRKEKQSLFDLKLFFGEWSDSDNVGQMMAWQIAQLASPQSR